MLHFCLLALLDLMTFFCLHKLLILDTLHLPRCKRCCVIYRQHLEEQHRLFVSVDDHSSHDFSTMDCGHVSGSCLCFIDPGGLIVCGRRVWHVSVCCWQRACLAAGISSVKPNCCLAPLWGLVWASCVVKW